LLDFLTILLRPNYDNRCHSMTLSRFYWQQLVTMEVMCLCYSETWPVWRNWQTQQTQNLPGITPREGSIPFTGTKNWVR
jgi:hypothetical protein